VDERLPAGEYDVLTQDPYSQMAMIAHEAFHVFQHHRAPRKGANELALKTYPVLSAGNNVGFALEGAALGEALRAPTDAECREAAARWLAIRKDRRSALSSEAVAYEDGTEFNEGLAKYIEYRLFQVLEGRTPGPAMQWIQGFRGYSDLEFLRERLIEQMERHMRGEVNVNNDPYGTAPLRMRFYYSGMAVAAILDRLDPGWHPEIMTRHETLTSLARDAIGAEPDELARLLESVKDSPDFTILSLMKEKLAAEGQSHHDEILDGIVNGENSLMTVDYSSLGSPRVAMNFTPFGILSLDDHRTIYRMIPVRVFVGTDNQLSQTRPSPLLHDEEKKLLQFQLAGRVSRKDLAEALGRSDIPAGTIEGCGFDLPGVRLEAGRAQIEWQDGGVTVKLVP
jgi:hypothetical protein